MSGCTWSRIDGHYCKLNLDPFDDGDVVLDRPGPEEEEPLTTVRWVDDDTLVERVYFIEAEEPTLIHACPPIPRR